MSDIVKGQMVISKAGRDKDLYFIVVDVQKPYVYLVDGKHRRLEHPKRKKEIHIQLTNFVDKQIQDLLEKNKVTNAEIRKCLSQRESIE
ncbi:MAG: KOW domain-containing RNA-binding protein [Vallitaleaceae bacterium]|nr:KOW domain-containing RNA-binding protein [Vallitaleaceae bacterium]